MTPHEALQISDLWELKQALDMAYVMEHYGHHPDHVQGGKLHYYSPFREENRASFDVFEHTIANRPEPEQRFDDFADPALNQGDVFDLISRFEPDLSKPAVHDRARELLYEQIRTQWSGATTERQEKVIVSVDNLQMLLDLGRPVRDAQAWWDTLVGRPGLKHVSLPSDTVFADPEIDAVVFLLRDREGELIGARRRFAADAEGKQAKAAVRGTPNVLMRLEPPSRKPVILTEGETDTWAAYGVHGASYEVLGVPGVGNPPAKVAGDELDGRDVTLMFDGDEAGAKGHAVWRAFLLERGCNVRVCVLPEGKDVSALNTDQISRLPERARVLRPAPSRLTRLGDQFFWITNKNGDVEELSNWSFVPRSVLIGKDDVRSYQGILLSSEEEVVLPAAALTSSAQLQAWGLPYQARWYGNNTQVQQLGALIDHEAAFLPEGRITDRVGLHEGTFVWQDGYLGPDPVYYTEPEISVSLDADKLSIEQAPVNPIEVFERMFESQNPAVTGPMLAWLAVAPLRSRFKQFPALSITGGSGSGKTTLTSELLRAFTGSQITTNLTSSTAHGVTAYFAASNGFPVWFDEYRPGARKEAKETIDQLIRDAYTGQASAKGGQNRTNLNKVTMISTDAPIVVTGEDNFTETSHTDRMVLVRLVASERGNLGALQDLDTRGFARAYLSSLQRSDAFVDDPPVRTTYRPDPVPGLRDRQGVNAAVLLVGWDLLRSFLHEYDPTYVMPELDLSRVIEAGEEAGATDPTMEAVRHCWEHADSLSGPVSVWNDEEYLYVNSNNLLSQASKIPGIVLPTTNSKGITKFLVETHGAEQKRVRAPVAGFGGAKQVRVCAIPLSRVEWVDEPTTPTPTEDI